MKNSSQKELFNGVGYNTENFAKAFEIAEGADMDRRCIYMERDQLERIPHMVQFQNVYLMLKGKYSDLIVMDRTVFHRKNIIGMKNRFQNIRIRNSDAVISFACDMVGQDADFL